MNARRVAIIGFLGFLLSVGITVPTAAQTMGSYCSVPPFATRSIAPNVMVVMDNSQVMLTEAYTGAYSPNGTKDNYIGYFKPQSCYAYSSNKFVEWSRSSGAACTDLNCIGYRNTDTCPSAAPFRGNLMNWATMSKYDILEKVLIGGNTASKQGNAHTLVGIGGTFADKTNSGCIFRVTSGNLTVTESVANGCSLLRATPTAIALRFNPDVERPSRVAALAAVVREAWQRTATALKPVVESLSRVWAAVGAVSEAWAGHAFGVQINTGTLNVNAGNAYSLTLECSGNGGNCPNGTYVWTVVQKPAWLGNPTYATSGSKINYRATFAGTPTTAGTYPLQVRLAITTTGGGAHTTTSADTTFSIVVSAPAPIINTTALVGGNVGTVYSTTLSGTGASPLTWAATGLPAGLSLNTATGEISGTPTAAGTSTVTVTLTSGTGTTATKALSLTIAAALTVNSQSYNIKVELIEEPLTDRNGNNIWDSPSESLADFTDSNGNGVWDGKQGIFQQFWDENTPKARWGLTRFSNAGVDIAACIPHSPASSFFTRVQNSTSVASSPLASALYEAIKYYAFGFNPAIPSPSSCTSSDPIDNVPCRKNFVLILSSGSNVGVSNFSDTSCTTVPNGNSSAALTQNACYGHNTDLRPDKTGIQNVFTYVVNTMGTTNTGILEDAAIAGGGEFYDATDPQGLEQALVNALTDILAKAASGTSVSVLTTSSRGTGSLVQSYFLPSRLEGARDVDWTGYLQNIWIDSNDNLREDTINDAALKLDEDNVMKLYYDEQQTETYAAMFDTDADGTGGPLASCGMPTIKPFRDIKPLWDGGKALALMDPADRTLFTAKRVNYGATTPYTFAETPYPTFDTSMNATLKNALNPDATFSSDNIISYIRGVDVEATDPNFRDRRVTVDGSLHVWKLGDVISSTPKVFANTPTNTYHIDYGDHTYYQYISDPDYTTKSALAFVGANDGVLHAFRIGYLKDLGLVAGVKALFKNLFSSVDDGATGPRDALGKEVWGYIPFNSLPYLKYFADTAYCHIYYNDLSVRLVDASIYDTATNTFAATTVKTASSWKTVLVGGMRFGGACNNGTPSTPIAGIGYSSYFALDITDPEAPVPLWEFSDPDMGYATTYPSVVRTGLSSQNGNWYVVVGSGSTTLAKADTDIARSTPGYVYMLDLATGALVKKIQVDHNGIVGDILAIDADKNYAAEKLYFGTAYHTTEWNGKLVSIEIPNQDLSTAGAPTIKYLFAGAHAFTASPDSARDAAGSVWVYAGAGKYYSDVDESDSQGQIFLGLKDLPSGITYPVTTAAMDNRTNVQTTGTVSGTTTACLYDAATNSFLNKTLVTSVTQTSAYVAPSATGWYIQLSTSPTSERVISRPLAVGGLVDFLTYRPSADACSYGGDSYLYAVDYTTGVAPATVAIRDPGVTGGTTSGAVTVASNVRLGPGAPPTGEAIIIPPPKEGKDALKKKIQVATGVIIEAENKPVISVGSKITHWLKK